MKTNWDVIIVGAGPAGSAAAITLARQGIDVLLVDKAVFPRDKVCGDGIVTASLEQLRSLGIEQNGFYPIYGVKIISPKKHTWHLKVQSKQPNRNTCIVPRTIFDTLLFQKALVCGSRFGQLAVKDLLVENGFICGIKGMINDKSINLYSKILIGADGANSVVARRLGRGRLRDCHRLIAMRGYLQDFHMESNTVEVYLLREIMPGYLWLFPIGNGQVNIGIGMRLDRYKKSSIDLKSLLMDFIMRDEIRERFSKKPEIFHLSSWPLLLASQKSIKRAYNGALLIGDAGAWIDPLTGGGICNALITGKIAGDVAAKALNQNTAKSTYLQNYEKMAKSRIGKEIRRSYIIQRSLGIFPNIVDPLIKWAGRSDMLVNAANRMYQDLHIWRVNESNPTV